MDSSNIPINIQNENEVHIDLMASENDLNNLSMQNLQNLSFQNNSMYPNIGKDNEIISTKLLKEKQGKILQKDLSFNTNQHFSFQQDGNDDTMVEKEESLQKVIRVNLNDLYNNPPIMNDQRVITTHVPKSLEDWIENHSKKALEEPTVSPEKPPSYIPVLETTEDLDEIITPKRSVSCRARNHSTMRAMKVVNQQSILAPTTPYNINNSMSMNINNSINYSTNNFSSRSMRNNSINAAVRKQQRISRQQPMIHISEQNEPYNQRSQANMSIDAESVRRLQTGIPKYQICSYKHCEYVATDRCEKCYDPLCLNHMKRFYYTLHFFTGKSLCIKCFRKIARSYLWVYFSVGVLMSILLIILLVSQDFKKNVDSIYKYLIYLIVATLAVVSFILSHVCNLLLNSTLKTLSVY